MNSWYVRLLQRLGFGDTASGHSKTSTWVPESSEAQTVLYFIETLRDNLVELPDRTNDQIRSEIDTLITKALSQTASPKTKLSAALWREWRMYFRDHRIAEVSFVTKALQDLRSLVWDFVNQLGAETQQIHADDAHFQRLFLELQTSLESDSPEIIRKKSRTFISAYNELLQKQQMRERQRKEKFAEKLRQLRTELTTAKENLSLDPMTKAHNRQAFDDQLARMVNFNQLSGGTSLLLMIDVDHFKKVNDTYGHPFGDTVLKELTNILFRTFPRKTDLVCRYGGEEFAVILKDADLAQAEAIAERLLQNVRSTTLVHKENKFQFSVSLGIASFDPTDTVETWLNRADQALYEAKRSGRDRFVVGSPTKDPLAA